MMIEHPILFNYANKGFGWDANPWAWVIEFEGATLRGIVGG